MGCSKSCFREDNLCLTHLYLLFVTHKILGFLYIIKLLKISFKRLNRYLMDIIAKQYGFFLSYVRQVIYRYLDCGILRNGFTGMAWNTQFIGNLHFQVRLITIA